MTTLLVDNYDSYTYNVFHLLAGVSGEEPIVVRNDMVSWRALSRWEFDAIVLSPGPGRPDRWHDFGVCSDILRSSDVPVLGVCLGHQGLGHALSGLVETAPMAMHGRLSRVQHDGRGLFAGVPQGFSVVRYHSLAVTGSIEPEGRVTAWTDDGVVMGIEHCRRPMWGVQFHPESIASEHGRTIVENFYALVDEHRRRRPSRPRGTAPTAAPATSRSVPPAAPAGGSGAAADGAPTDAPAAARSRVALHVRSLDGEPDTQTVFNRLFAHADHAFWLDSADAPTRLAQGSYLGTSAGADRCILTYDVEQGTVTVDRRGGRSVVQASIFDVLDRELADVAVEPPPGVDRGLVGGFVGYLGYECKADCGSPNLHRSDVPDAVMLFADRVVAVDHVRHRTHLLALSSDDGHDARRWLDEAEAGVRAAMDDGASCATAGAPATERGAAAATERGALAPAEPGAAAATTARAPAPAEPVVFRSGRGRSQYLADIARCQAALAAGESYEVCLTDQFSTTASPDPLTLYRLLRRRNPAPFSAFLKLGDVAVVSSSPERFLSVDRDRRVEARPIKGTAARRDEPAADEAVRAELRSDEKTFAEHLMIVDLLRNDLGRVCEVDSVRVPELMVIESYATVHQMVSTITGALECRRTPVECVRACFPGGSMTGAPKLRTMSIIDDVEREARGVYSGAIGYFGADGSADLSIVIRTIVLRPGATTIGAGGAIVMQSDPVEEFDEILLKARAPMAAIAEVVTGRRDPAAWTVEIEPSGVAAVAS